MSNGRRGSFFRTHGKASIRFGVSFVLLGVAALCFYFFVVKYDFSANKNGQADALGEAKVQTVPAVPTLKPNPRLAQEEGYTQTVESVSGGEIIVQLVNANLTNFEVVQRDRKEILMLQGWGYIKSRDASLSGVQIALIPDVDKQSMLSYRVTMLPGASNYPHDTGMGKNLDQSDFMAAINVSDIPDGRYTVGVIISYKEDDSPIVVLAPLSRYQLSVINAHAVIH